MYIYRHVHTRAHVDLSDDETTRFNAPVCANIYIYIYVYTYVLYILYTCIYIDIYTHELMSTFQTTRRRSS